ncbi:MAG TPA: AmmeMemoRadiSam system radical SAM enzyme [Nitrososphaerales archaeon]|nr:AmmeMemoRadiSam system radical SAM enzyme [Nitrososphaerales archaeon]
MVEKEAILWELRENGRVTCNACYRRCLIPDGSHGFCYVRKNVGGKLYLSTYGKLAAMQIDPVEKKPFNHFYPGTYVFTVGTVSCNWHCLFCQNHSISKETDVYGEDVSPEEIPELAIGYNCEGVGFSYNEPTIFIEYVIDAAREAHRRGRYTVFVTNGYGTVEAVRAIKGYVDAVVVDYKGSGEQIFQRRQTMTVSAEPIKQTLLELKKQGIHTELTDLIIPQVGEDVNEARKLCSWLYDNLGPDVPIQFTSFHPDYKMMNVPGTPYETLLSHYKIGKEIGLNYVYIGNVPGNPYEHTYCPGCKKVVIERYGFMINGWNLDDKNNCESCGYRVPITGKRAKYFHYRDIESFYIPVIKRKDSAS